MEINVARLLKRNKIPLLHLILLNFAFLLLIYNS